MISLNVTILSRVILITGTPGVGKTSIGNILKDQGYFVLNLNNFIVKNGLYFGYDYSRESVIIDEEKLKDSLQNELLNYSDYIFVEGHTAELVPDEFVHSVFVLRCNPGILRQRLQSSRDYSTEKIEENIQAEIMEECLLSVKNEYSLKPIYELDTSTKSPEILSKKIISKF